MKNKFIYVLITVFTSCGMLDYKYISLFRTENVSLYQKYSLVGIDSNGSNYDSLNSSKYSNLNDYFVDSVPLSRSENLDTISRLYNFYDFTYSGYEDSNIWFKYPQVIQIKNVNFNLDSILYNRSRDKVEYDFTAADLYVAIDGQQTFLIVNSPQRFFFHCESCSMHLLLIFEINNEFPKLLKYCEYDCLKNTNLCSGELSYLKIGKIANKKLVYVIDSLSVAL